MANQCAPAVADPLAATVSTLIRDTSVVEAVELSNIDSGGSSIDCERLNGALADAYALLKSEQLLLPSAAREVITLNLSRWMVIIARYYLDNVRRRPDVTADFERVMTKIKDLGLVSALDASAVQGSISATYGKQPVWTQQSLSAYRSQM
jgi:hypothetical protein